MYMASRKTTAADVSERDRDMKDWKEERPIRGGIAEFVVYDGSYEHHSEEQVERRTRMIERLSTCYISRL